VIGRPRSHYPTAAGNRGGSKPERPEAGGTATSPSAPIKKKKR